jgi:hypothetical protein
VCPLVTVIIKRKTIASAANANALVQNFHGRIHMIGQKGIRQDYEVNDSVCCARSGFRRQATLKVRKPT